MSFLVAYDRMCAALAEASKLQDVIALRGNLEHVKLHARQIQDRELLANAIEVQMRAERKLGLMLAQLKQEGVIAEGRRPKKDLVPDAQRVTLEEIAVDRPLSAKAQRAAAMDAEIFEGAIAAARDKTRAGRAILVDPVQVAEKAAELGERRAAHAARAMTGGTVKDLGELALSGFRAKFIGSDPQWKFLTRSAEGDARSANVHYRTEEVDKIKALPVGELAAEDSMLGMWMVDWCPQDAIDLMKHYGFKHVTTLYTWVKTNGEGGDIWDSSTWAFGQGYWTRANPEACWLGTRGHPKRLHADVRQLIVAPLMEHSRKPDEWLARSERLSEGPFLELQARRPRPGWVSWGDELEFTGKPMEQETAA